MNNFDPLFSSGGEAELRYENADYRVIKPGRFVRCAVSGVPIALEDLKYWNAQRQEAYASAEMSLQRHLAVRAAGASV